MIQLFKHFILDNVNSNNVSSFNKLNIINSKIINIHINEIICRLRSTYELFNFNAYSFTEDTMRKSVEIYKNLTEKLGLNDENLSKMYMKNYERTFGKIMLKYDLSKFEELVKFAKRNNILLVNDNPYSFILNDNFLSLLAVKNSKNYVL